MPELIAFVLGFVIAYVVELRLHYIKEPKELIKYTVWSFAVVFAGAWFYKSGGSIGLLIASTTGGVWLGFFTQVARRFITGEYVIGRPPEEKRTEPEYLTTAPPPEPDYTIPTEARFSHQLILASSGHGKTQLISEQVAGDLQTPCSVVVFDSQGDIVDNVLKVQFPRERVVLIDPTDIEHPVALGLFDFARGGETAYERERNLNSIIELLSFVLNSLLSSQLTSKQDVALRFVIRLCLQIPDANIHTLRGIFSTDFAKYQRYTENLSESAQAFFRTEFQSRQFSETREQILRRIYSLVENQTLERIFSATKTKLNLREKLDDGSVILVNSAKSLLKEEGSAFFTRFIIALITQAVQERDPAKNNMPVFIYIDEASPIIDQNIATILETCRKYSAGLTLSFQSLGQILAGLEHTIITNTATKCLGGISARDAKALADDVHAEADSLMRVPKLHFYEYVKDHHSRTRPVKPGYLSKLPKRTDLHALIAENREKYCTVATEQKNVATPDDDIEAINRA